MEASESDIVLRGSKEGRIEERTQFVSTRRTFLGPHLKRHRYILPKVPVFNFVGDWLIILQPYRAQKKPHGDRGAGKCIICKIEKTTFLRLLS